MDSSAATSLPAAPPPRPPFWFKLSITIGNILQIDGLIIGAALLITAATVHIAAVFRVVLMLAGTFLIYICCHALAHWAVGRLGGIRFQGYGLRGTDHPENYPPGLRQLMSALPTFTVMTQKDSMQKARRLAKALMFGAGETSTVVCSILCGWYAWRSGIPGGIVLFWVMVMLNLVSTVVTATIPRGDYTKARQAWQGKTIEGSVVKEGANAAQGERAATKNVRRARRKK